MKSKRILIPLCLLCAALLPAVAQAQFTFTTNNGALPVTAYTGSGGAVIIPDTTNNLPVKSLGDKSFYNCTNLTAITIPDSITNCGI